MSKIELKLDEFEDDDEFTLFGVRTSITKEYKFVYWLNRELQFQFHRIEDLDIYMQGNLQCHSMYFYEDMLEGVSYRLIQNASHSIPRELDSPATLFGEVGEKQFLLKKYKFYNYLLKLNTSLPEDSSFELSLQQLSFIDHLKRIDRLSKNEKRTIFI